MILLMNQRKINGKLFEKTQDSRCQQEHSWEEVKMSLSMGVWKQVMPALNDDFEGSQMSVVGIIVGVKIAKALDWQWNLRGVNCTAAISGEVGGELFLTEEQRKQLLKTESLPGEGGVNT